MKPHHSGSFLRDDDPGELTTGVPRLSVTLDESVILSAIAAGRRVLEIGTGLGVSTKALALHAIEVVTVDIDKWVQSTIWPTLPANVTCCASTDEIVGTFHVVFIDGDHTTAGVATDLAIAERFAPHGLIVAHDSEYPTPRAALGLGWTFIPTTHGLALRWN